jgi:hypothetical protein
MGREDIFRTQVSNYNNVTISFTYGVNRENPDALSTSLNWEASDAPIHIAPSGLGENFFQP